MSIPKRTIIISMSETEGKRTWKDAKEKMLNLTLEERRKVKIQY